MPANGNPANSVEPQSTAVDLEAVTVFLKAEGRETVFALEPWVSRLLPGPDTPEEALKGTVYIDNDHLEHMAVDVPSIRIACLQLFDLAELLNRGD